jgi:hypothetical protein
MKHPLSTLRAAALLLALAGLPSTRGAVVQADMAGVVQSAFFGAASFLPVGTSLAFRATFATDPALNPDESPSATIGLYALTSLAVSGVGEAGPASSNDVSVQNEATDALDFILGFGQLPAAGGFAFNSAFLRLRDPSGSALTSDALPTSIMSFTAGSFSLRWGGADGPAVGGLLWPVPEPSPAFLLLGATGLLLQTGARRRR